ncbi:hypothetical protein K439DRAFT_1623682 [Ramaria rubella]|nr:hypothetical protein K439DRAFT_1623682 [Ramaria rubella]
MSSAASSSDNKRIRSVRGHEPIQVKIIPTLDRSVELTLYTPTTAPDKTPTISTPTTPTGIASSTSSFSLAAPNDVDIINLGLLLVQSKPKSAMTKPKSAMTKPKSDESKP